MNSKTPIDSPALGENSNQTTVNQGVLTPTSTPSNIDYNPGQFETLTEGLEYAARGNTGFNFYSGRGELKNTLSYKELYERAIFCAHRLVCVAESNDRVGICATTSTDFAVLFFACQYAGLIPAPFPLPITLGGRGSYERQLQRMADTGDFSAVLTPASMESIISSALNDHDMPIISFEDVPSLQETGNLRPHGKGDFCYIQYSSGSSSSPKGVIGTQHSVIANCQGIVGGGGLDVRMNDRCVSWLPLYHDMGLIGFMIAPLLSQLSVDYLDPQDFTRRPLMWLKLIHENRATLSYSPTFGYELCAKRWREDFDLDLSCWRAAGIGGDMVQPQPLQEFTKTFSSMGFGEGAFTPSYGLAETTLAATFSPLGQGLLYDTIDMKALEHTGDAKQANDLTAAEHKRTFIACGRPIPYHQMEVHNEFGQVLGNRKVGRIFIKGESVAPGYFHNIHATQAVFSEDGWLDTGDLGYWLDDQLVVTGRFKDLILWHGRNIWPQDIEWAAQAAAPNRCGRACSFAVGGNGDEKTIILLLECRTRDEIILDEIYTAVSAAIRLEIGAPVELILVPRGSMIITSSGKLSRARVREKFLSGFVIDLKDKNTVHLVASGTTF